MSHLAQAALTALIVLAISCGSGKSEPAPLAETPSSEPATQARAPDSAPVKSEAQGSERELYIEQMVADSTDYAEQAMLLHLEYQGDCANFAEKMLALEPLALSLRSRFSELVARGEDGKALAEEVDRRIKAHAAQAMARIEKTLGERGASMESFEKTEAAFRAKCADHPRVVEVMDRVGVFKKKTP